MSRLVFPIRLDRRLQLWSYNVGHSVLLLRSNTGEGAATRIDLMFRAVSSLKLRQVYTAIEIGLMPSEDVASRADLDGVDLEDRFVFTIGTVGANSDYVVAGSLHLAEDVLSDHEPSLLDHPERHGELVSAGYYQ